MVFTGAEYNRLLNYNYFVRGCDEGGSDGDGGGGLLRLNLEHSKVERGLP